MATTTNAPSNSQNTANAASGAASIAGGIIAGPIGAAIAGAVGNLIGGLFGGGKTFAQASTELHEWVRHNLHTEHALQWIKANYPRAFTDIDTVKKLQWIYLLQHDPENTAHHLKWVGVPKYWVGGTWASNAAYLRELGIDVAASEAAQLADPAGLAAVGGANEFIGDHVKHVNAKFIRGTANNGTTPAPSPAVVNEMREAAQRVENKDARGNDRAIVKNLDGGGGGLLSGIVPLLLIAIVAFAILRR